MPDGGSRTPGDEGDDTQCPLCGSASVTLRQRRGSARCRTLYTCDECSEPFEKFG